MNIEMKEMLLKKYLFATKILKKEFQKLKFNKNYTNKKNFFL